MILQIVLGNQLFPQSFYKESSLIFMSEDFGLCTHFKYHKHKLIFFLASMRNYRDELIAAKKKVTYYELKEGRSFFGNLKEVITKYKVKQIAIYEIEDKFFETEIMDFCFKNEIDIEIKKSPMFLVSRETFKQYNDLTKKPFMKTFYESLRRSTKILMDKNGKPEGGRFSFDAENRKKIPKKFEVINNPLNFEHDKNTKDVIEAIDDFFPDHPGEGRLFWMHVNRQGALSELHYFFENKFHHFGDFEDAIDDRDPFLYHSVLSPYLNIGFLTPDEIVREALKQKVSLNSKEGFIRQIIGWREFVRGIYQEYSEVQDQKNFFNHSRRLSKSWYNGTTGIVPLDDAIKKVVRFGYCHHIERLMVISNIMLLSEIDPREVHRWFMEMFVDSSDWVMGPNVYGMAQFSDGGIFATKPYIGASNYILKMSHYERGEWCEILDGLYWRFIDKHRNFFLKNYRMNMMVKLLDKMDQTQKEKLIQKANQFISKNCPN
ncbi:MAG: cryptochrome/photolyase family protein [Bacteriovoracaceae bacterium]